MGVLADLDQKVEHMSKTKNFHCLRLLENWECLSEDLIITASSSNLEMVFFKHSKGNFVLKSCPIKGAIILPSQCPNHP